ncbi:MAG: ABC transporter permease [Oscillospiraceae bacterium]|nr:ABC transporter permease [Oscillospiraceae bacterium]
MRYWVKKIFLLLITLFAVSLLVFLAFQIIPGDPATRMLGTSATPERLEALREELGLNRPVLVRYGDWLWNFLHGDAGTSYTYSTPVSALLRDKIPVTLTLSAITFLLVLVISFPLGLLLAQREDTLLDRILTPVNQVIMSIPPFFTGILFCYVFGIMLKLFAPGNYVSFQADPLGHFIYLFFAALAIALPKSAMTIKMLRGSIAAEMEQDYIRTAYARGNTRYGALRRHALRNAIVPIITFLAMTLADIIAGSIVVEQVFSIPGLGRLLLSSISGRDYPVVQAIVVFIAFLVVATNFIADIINQRIDPRLRLS